ncbi:hypothetical protein BD770DRAFT_412693 [Pilaira anomala]|nr:hypothetical protein BD770DRAFT_412693 [Pilaira anomala]
MTVEMSPSTEVTTKGKEVTLPEPTLSTQVEPAHENTPIQGEESEEKLVKKKGLFNFAHHKGPKKDAATNTEDVITTSGALADQPEHKKSKGFGHFLSRVKQTTSSHNIKDLSEHETNDAAAAVEHENEIEHEDMHENVKTAETPTPTPDHAKRQSLLSKLFGNTKKEPMIDSTDQVHTLDHQQQTAEEVAPSSPPLSRRVTGFFSKRKSTTAEKKNNNNTKSTHNEKTETDQQDGDVTETTDSIPLNISNNNQGITA